MKTKKMILSALFVACGCAFSISVSQAAYPISVSDCAAFCRGFLA